MVRFSDNTKILKHENKVLYANCENGKWLRVSEEVAQIIAYYNNIFIRRNLCYK